MVEEARQHLDLDRKSLPEERAWEQASVRESGKLLASPTTPSWNQLAKWLRDMDSIRAAFGNTAA